MWEFWGVAWIILAFLVFLSVKNEHVKISIELFLKFFKGNNFCVNENEAAEIKAPKKKNRTWSSGYRSFEKRKEEREQKQLWIIYR